MDDLVAFIKARLDEDEQGAMNAVERDWRPDGANSCQVYVMRPDYTNRTIAWCRNGYDDDFANALHIARHDPARVLRDVASARVTLAAITSWTHTTCSDGWYSCSQATEANGIPLDMACADDDRAGQPCDCGLQVRQLAVVRPLAQRYADHPDFRTEWAA